MSQPEWKLVYATDDRALFVDTTGVHDAELMVAEEVEDAPESARFQIFRFPLERQKLVVVEDARHMVPIAWDETWRYPIHNYKPWFYKDLHTIAETCSVEREALIDDLISDEPMRLVNAYECIAGYSGFNNFDNYPRTVSEEQMEDWPWHVPASASAAAEGAEGARSES